MAAVTPRPADWLVSAGLALAFWVFDAACLVVAFLAVGAPQSHGGPFLWPTRPGSWPPTSRSPQAASAWSRAASPSPWSPTAAGQASTVAAVLVYRMISFWGCCRPGGCAGVCAAGALRNAQSAGLVTRRPHRHRSRRHDGAGPHEAPAAGHPGGVADRRHAATALARSAWPAAPEPATCSAPAPAVLQSSARGQRSRPSAGSPGRRAPAAGLAAPTAPPTVTRRSTPWRPRPASACSPFAGPIVSNQVVIGATGCFRQLRRGRPRRKEPGGRRRLGGQPAPDPLPPPRA